MEGDALLPFQSHRQPGHRPLLSAEQRARTFTSHHRPWASAIRLPVAARRAKAVCATQQKSIMVRDVCNCRYGQLDRMNEWQGSGRFENGSTRRSQRFAYEGREVNACQRSRCQRGQSSTSVFLLGTVLLSTSASKQACGANARGIRIALEDEPGFASVTLLRGQIVCSVYGTVLPVGRGDL